jgi:hypothetical protein
MGGSYTAFTDHHSSPLRLHIRSLIARGTLPREPQIKTWLRAFRGKGCQACGSAITSSLEVELEFENDRMVLLHKLCFDLWSDERERHSDPRVPTVSNDPRLTDQPAVRAADRPAIRPNTAPAINPAPPG